MEWVPPPHLNTALLDLLGITPFNPSTTDSVPSSSDTEFKSPMSGLLTNISLDSSLQKPLPHFSDDNFSPPSSPELGSSMVLEPEPVTVKSEIILPPALPTPSTSELTSNPTADALLPLPNSGTTVTVEMPSETPVASDTFQTPVYAQQQPKLLPKPIVPVIRGSQPVIQTTSSSVVSLVPVKMPQLPSQQLTVRAVTPVSTPPSIPISSPPVSSSPVMPIPSVQMIDTIRLPSLSKPMTSLVKGAY